MKLRAFAGVTESCLHSLAQPDRDQLPRRSCGQRRSDRPHAVARSGDCGDGSGRFDRGRRYRLNDLFSSIPVHAGNLLSVIAFEHLDQLKERARVIVEADRKAWNGFLDDNPRLSAPRTRWGTTAFVRLIGGDTERFVERLREEYDTSVVPGRFFGSPAHFRIGMGVDHAMFTEGLRRISELLARF